MNIGESKDNLSGLLHGADVDDLESWALLYERTANNLLTNITPIDTQRTVPLVQAVHDDIYNYPLPSDFRELVDLYPQDNRESFDTAIRRSSRIFDLRKAIHDKEVAIEGSEGTKFIRINWKGRQASTLHNMDSVTANGTWSVVGTATGLQANSIFKMTGSASIEFDAVVDGDGIQNSDMTAVDMTDEDEVADVYVWMYFGAVSALTSVSAIWGNDLTTNFWTAVAQTTQADGTAFKVGWNLLRFPWSTASQTGTVDPATIDSFKLTIDRTAQIDNIRVDNIIFSIGRNFDIKYNSKFLFKNSAGVWISKPTDDTDTINLDNDAINIFQYELLKEAAFEIESSNSGGDIEFANLKLHGDSSSSDPKMRIGLYGKYARDYPDQMKKVIGSYGGKPSRGRW